MPAAPTKAFIVPRWQNGTDSSSITSGPSATETGSEPTGDADFKPSITPEPSYSSVTVVPADRIQAKPTPHTPIPKYPGAGAILNQGYCTEPAYTILDGPTALWVPVVGCISSKADCCPSNTGGSGAAPTGVVNNGGSGPKFPISSMPSQPTLVGCPKDYHTVDKTACCPSSYWLWSTEMGGQVPCFSALKANLAVPPIPDTLVMGMAERTREGSLGITSTGTTTSAAVPASTSGQKPTSAIANIAFAMQYPMVPVEPQGMKKEVKIGIGVGAAGAAVLLLALVFFVVRNLRGRKNKKEAQEITASQRFGDGVDMSRVAHQPPAPYTTYEGAKYVGVSTNNVHY